MSESPVESQLHRLLAFTWDGTPTSVCAVAAVGSPREQALGACSKLCKGEMIAWAGRSRYSRIHGKEETGDLLFAHKSCRWWQRTREEDSSLRWTVMDEDDFKDEILVDPYSRGWGGISSGDSNSFSYNNKFQRSQQLPCVLEGGRLPMYPRTPVPAGGTQVAPRLC